MNAPLAADERCVCHGNDLDLRCPVHGNHPSNIEPDYGDEYERRLARGTCEEER